MAPGQGCANGPPPRGAEGRAHGDVFGQGRTGEATHWGGCIGPGRRAGHGQGAPGASDRAGEQGRHAQEGVEERGSLPRARRKLQLSGDPSEGKERVGERRKRERGGFSSPRSWVRGRGMRLGAHGGGRGWLGRAAPGAEAGPRWGRFSSSLIFIVSS
jgi:hypothetical protein